MERGVQRVCGGTEVVAGPVRGNLEQPTESSPRWGRVNAVGASCRHRSPVSSGRTRCWPVAVGHRAGELGHLCGPPAFLPLIVSCNCADCGVESE